MQLFRTPLAVVLALVVVAGFAIGGLLAVFTRGSRAPESTVAATTVASQQMAARTQAPRPATPAPTAVPTVTPAAVPTATPTRTPTSAPTVAPTRIATPVPRATVAVTTSEAPGGTWEIDEANTQVGTIVWVGTGAPSQGHSIALDVHKASIAGRTASSCERRSTLHAAFALGVGTQTVPYEEVNCQGTALPGEVRVASFASDGRSFSGTFWAGGVRLGSFTARLRR